jgi:hypothetical protein
MKKNNQMVKLFLTLFLCTAFIFSSSFVGSWAVGKNKGKENQAVTKTQKKVKQAVQQTAVTSSETIIAEATVNLGETPEDLQTFVETVSKIDIPTQTNFSLLEFVKKKKLGTMNSDSLSMIATGIYQAILPTNFSIGERNIGSTLPAYANLGFAAKVNAAENEDLAFSNPNNTNFALYLQLNNNTLTVALKGKKLPYDYKIAAKQALQLEPKTIIQYSPLLSPAQTKVMDPGKNGQSIKVYRESYQGAFLKVSELISNDYYPPEYRVEVHGLVSNQQTASGAENTAQSSTGTSTDQTNQVSQTTSGDQSTTVNTTSQTTSDLWGKTDEESK